MSDDAATGVDDARGPTDLDSIFNNVDFWANKSSKVPERFKELLKAKVQELHEEEQKEQEEQKDDSDDSDDSEDVKRTLQRSLDEKIRSEKKCKERILERVRSSDKVRRLRKTLGKCTTDYGPTLTGKWLSDWLDVKNAIPQCILDAARTSNDDSESPNLNNPRQSILKKLAEIRGHHLNGFRGLQYTSTTDNPDNTGCAHYIGDPKFRHQGINTRIPPIVFIQKRGDSDGKIDRVHVYHQESGSGKTVELAASAYTRDALFTIVTTFSADVALIPDGHEGLDGVRIKKTRDDTRKDYRRRDALSALTSAVRRTWRKGPRCGELIKFIHKLDDERNKKGIRKLETLQVVVAIDEAGSRPNLVRAVISDYAGFGTMLGAFIMSGCDPDGSLHINNSVDEGATPAKLKVEVLENPLKTLTVNVLFSIAGTGASHGTVGSVSENFAHLKPSAKVDPKQVYNILRQGFTSGGKANIIPQYGELKQFPLLKALVDSNARMISIYMDCANSIRDNNENTNKKANAHAQEQSAVLSHTFVRFIKSNGMSGLKDKPYFARLTALRAIAVLLFQQTAPFPRGLKDIHVSEMDYGISFERVEEDYKDRTIMQMLVAKYGLVTAKPFQTEFENMPEAEPFELSGAMQLLCLWLIQGGTQAPTDKSFLGTTSTSFETLTGLLVGAAIGASAVIKKDKNGRVLAAPALGYEHGETAQQEADIFSALRKVGMTVTRTNAVAGAAAAPPSPSYTCGTTRGPKPVESGTGDLFWSLKGAHAVFRLEGPGIPGVHFHKSMMTCITTVADKGRIQAVVNKREDAEFRKMNEVQFGEDGNLQVTPLRKVRSNAIEQSLHSNHSILADEELLRIHCKLLGLKNQLSGSPGTSQHTTGDAVKISFFLPFISIADGNSNFADAYVTFLVESPMDETDKKRYSLRTICIQAKDYAKGTSPDMQEYKKNLDAVMTPGLDTLFGGDRIYTVAGTRSKVAWGYTGGEFPYVPFVVDDSEILKNQLTALSQGRQQTAKQGEYAAFLPGPTTDATSSTQDADESLNAQFDPPGETKKRSNERGQDASDNDNVNPPKKQKPST